MEFGSTAVIIMFVLPAILAGIFAMKGKPVSATETNCKYCYGKINAAAKVCPHCRRADPVALGDKNFKKAWNNTPKTRFIAGYVAILVAELLIAGGIALLFN